MMESIQVDNHRKVRLRQVSVKASRLESTGACGVRTAAASEWGLATIQVWDGVGAPHLPDTVTQRSLQAEQQRVELLACLITPVSRLMNYGNKIKA